MQLITYQNFDEKYEKTVISQFVIECSALGLKKNDVSVYSNTETLIRLPPELKTKSEETIITQILLYHYSKKRMKKQNAKINIHREP